MLSVISSEWSSSHLDSLGCAGCLEWDHRVGLIAWPWVSERIMRRCLVLTASPTNATLPLVENGSFWTSCSAHFRGFLG